MIVIEKLDGFTADGFGHVIGNQQSLGDGDVMRITNGKDVLEKRYYAPVAPSPVLTPREVRKWEFAEFATAAVGSAGAFGTIIKACRDSADNAVIGAYELFKSQSTLTKNEATALLTLLAAKTIITVQQKTDILAAWPTA